MRILKCLLTILILVSCSSKQPPAWDSGAQKQESFEDETQREQQDRLRNQFPGRPMY